MHHFIQWMTDSAALIAVAVTVGVGLLLFCCLGCTNCGCREKDDLFRQRHI